MSSELTAATAIVRDGISNGNTDEQIARRVLDAARAGEGLREAARNLVRLWFDIAGVGEKSYAAMHSGEGDEFTEAMWALRAALHPDTAAEPGEDLNHLNATTFPDTVPGTCYVHKTYDCPMCHPRTLAATERTDEPGGEP